MTLGVTTVDTLVSTFTARAALWRRSGRRWIAVVCSGRQRLDRCCYLVQGRGIQGNVQHFCQLLAAQGMDVRYQLSWQGAKTCLLYTSDAADE